MNVFDGMAQRYDTDERARIATVIADKIRQRVAGCGDKTAIDYGCGTGLVGLQLTGCFRSLLMVDASPPMVEQVQLKIESMGLAHVKALYADFAQAVPPGLGADVVFMAQVLLHIPDVEGILRRLYGLLNPGGRLLIVDFDKEESISHEKVHNGFVQAELIETATRAGFAAAQAETFYHGQRIFMDRDASLFILQAEKPLEATGEIRAVLHRDDAALDRILEVWESSVRATHTFLSQGDIEALKPEVRRGALHVGALHGYYEGGVMQGFVGVQDGKVEMLFVDAAARGRGIGGELLRYAMGELGARCVDVNEQNTQGAAFYAHMGFQTVARSPLDEQGRPFPILHLRLT